MKTEVSPIFSTFFRFLLDLMNGFIEKGLFEKKLIESDDNNENSQLRLEYWRKEADFEWKENVKEKDNFKPEISN